jgi:DNA-binding PadR family transcriptional regulator
VDLEVVEVAEVAQCMPAQVMYGSSLHAMSSKARKDTDTDRAAVERVVPSSVNDTAASLLGFLNSFGSMTGFDLMTAAENISGDFWHVTKSQIYRELKILNELGYIASLETGTRDKQPYAITSAGRDAFRAWMRLPPAPPNMRMQIVLQVFFGSELPFDQLKSNIASMRAHHVERLRVYEEDFGRTVEKGSWPHEALRLGIMFQKTLIAWLDSLPSKPKVTIEKSSKPAKKKAARRR